MFPEQDMMLEVDRHLIAQHNINHRDQLPLNRDGHIGDAQRSLWIMQLGAGHTGPERTIRILLKLIGRGECPASGPTGSTWSAGSTRYRPIRTLLRATLRSLDRCATRAAKLGAI